MKNLTKILIILAFVFSFAGADVLFGKVVKITDGDTITVLDGLSVQHKIRLFGIDAPEKKQAYGNAAKQHLSNMIVAKFVKIEYGSKDRYKRILGTVFLGNEDINAKMVKDGFAWAFVRYSKRYKKEEYEARTHRRGLWSDTNVIAPWDFRKKK